MQFLTSLVCTFFGIGKIRFAPGTFGSLAGAVICFQLLDHRDVDEICILLFSLSWILFYIGVFFSDRFIKEVGTEDPKQIVIDEVVGMMLTFVIAMFFIKPYHDSEKLSLLIISFVSFRIFDIWKPWPISFCDAKIKGGIGVMLDDVIAAIFAGISTLAVYVILRALEIIS